MNDDPNNTDNRLDLEYNEALQAHRDYLSKIQEAFDRKCESIGSAAKDKLASIPDSDKEERKQVLLDEQAQLDKTLAELKEVVNRSSREMRSTLEAIEAKRGENAIDLESELANL